MQRDRYLEHLARDGARIAELAEGDLTVPVPTCPDWTLADLVEHTGFVHRWQTAAVRDRVSDFPHGDTWRYPPADGQSWGDWLREGVDEAVRVLGAVEASEHRWTWFQPDQTAGWYHRRMTLETLVHRIDAELAATGTVGRVDPVLAVDGIDEMFDVFIPAAGEVPVGGKGETLHLHTTDADGEWILTLRPTTVDVTRGHAKADCAVRGAALDLLLFVWHRDAVGDVEVFGDRSIRDLYFDLADR